MLSLWRKTAAAINLLRPGNVAVTGISVLVGTGGNIPQGGWPGAAMAMVSAMMIAGGGNSLNDFFDLAIDRINRPERPLPSGLLPPGAALAIGHILLAGGTGLGFAIGTANGVLALAVSLLLALYAARGKRLSLLGNLLVAVICGLAFVYGGLVSTRPWLSAFPAAFALLMHLAREVVKDVQDAEGDGRLGARTVAVAWGRQPSLRFASAVLGLLIVLTPVPYLLNIYNLRYLVGVILGVDLFLLVIIRLLLREPSREQVGQISFYLKIDMLVGMVAICAGL